MFFPTMVSIVPMSIIVYSSTYHIRKQAQQDIYSSMIFAHNTGINVEIEKGMILFVNFNFPTFVFGYLA
jgi:hypothetical protein